LPFVDTGLVNLKAHIKREKIFTADKTCASQAAFGGGAQKKAVLTLYMLKFPLVYCCCLTGMQGIWVFSAIVITGILTIQWAKSFGLLDFFNKNPQNEKK